MVRGNRVWLSSHGIPLTKPENGEHNLRNYWQFIIENSIVTFDSFYGYEIASYATEDIVRNR